MSKASERTTQTIARLREEKPVLRGLIDAFEPIWLAQRQEVDRLQEQFALHNMDLPARDPQRFSQGVSLLTGGDLAPLWPFARECSASLLQHFASNSQLLPKFDAVAAFLEKEQDKAFSNDFLRALLDMDDERMATLVEGSDEERASITFVCEFLLSTVLKAFTANIAAGEKDPWTLWTQGHCPVCGRLPAMEWLGQPVEDDNNPYLLKGGGRKYLHCGMCGADWKYRRAVCPACGSDKKGAMNIFYATSNQSEHVAWCSECKTYCVGLDMRAISPVPDLDVMALGLLPLDIVAAEKELTPMCRTLWNQL